MNLIGIDVGTTTTKVGVFDPLGQVLALREAPTSVVWDSSDSAHHDANALWETVAGLLRNLSEWTLQTAAIGISSFGEAGVLVDAEGQPISPVLAWFDPRPKSEFGRIAQLMPSAQWRSLTGLLPDSNYGLCKLLWLQKNFPLTPNLTWLPIADWIAFKLSGQRRMGLTQASRTLALDLRKGQWLEGVLSELELSHLMPPLRFPGETIGTITSEAAQQTGLPRSAKVMETGHDQPLAAVGVGAQGAGTLVNSCGTAEVLFAVFDQSKLNQALQASNVAVGAYATSGNYYAMASLRASGLVWDWWVAGSQHPQAKLLELAQNVPLGSQGLRFLPHLRPLYDDPNQPQLGGGAFVGLRETHGLAHMTRAVLEGLSFECWQLQQNILKAIGDFTPPIRAVGGASRNAVWMQSKAELLQTPLQTYASPHAAAWGAAWLAGHHLGLVPPIQLHPQAQYNPTAEVGELLESYQQTLGRLIASGEGVDSAYQ